METNTSLPTRSTPFQGKVKSLILRSPLTGHLLPIEEVPDPVFAQKMVGDGLSVDPLNQVLVAPVDGKITQLHSANHAVTIATEEGVEILMHIGIDTVKLRGVGFQAKVKVGDHVRTGEVLIEFDADYVATHAKSLLTQIVITNGEKKTLIKSPSGKVSAGQDVILEILDDTSSETTQKSIKNSSQSVSETISIINSSGLHARPAAILAGIAKKYKSEIRLQRNQDQANAKSLVAILGLEIAHADQVVVVADGPDASDAVKELISSLKGGLGEKAEEAPECHEVTPSQKITHSQDPNLLIGVPASQGLAVGNVFQIRHQEIEVRETAENVHEERQQLTQALGQAKTQLEDLRNQLENQSKSQKGAIFAAHQELLEDPDLLEITFGEIQKGKTAAFAWKKAYSLHADRLAALTNELLAARANDLRDVGRRVLLILTNGTSSTDSKSGQSDLKNVKIPAHAILVAENLTPSDTASLDRSKVLGFCTTTGGSSSHVAILARSLGIPAIAGIDPAALLVPSGAPVILDGNKGTLRLNPGTEEIAKIQKIQEEMEIKRKQDLSQAQQLSSTLDGHRVEVCANIGGLADAEQAMTLGGEGVGLLRSEFLFLKRTVAPTENEQYSVYDSIARALGPKHPLTIRTLDIGGDKPLTYLPIPKEENPFLGERGIRVSLNHPEIFRIQLKAILRAAEGGQVRIMFPMVATFEEWRQAKAILDEERKKFGKIEISTGIMIEVPAAAILAETFAKEVDFFSIGTNDLTQYTLAMDRGHPKLAPHTDGLHPSVLHLIAHTVKAAHRHNKWVGICGGIASDLQAVPILIGLGVDELSVSVPTIPGIKARIRKLRLSDCQQLAAQALEKSSAAEVRALVPNTLE